MFEKVIKLVSSIWKLHTEVMCKDDWNTKHRRWLEKICLLTRGDHIKIHIDQIRWTKRCLHIKQTCSFFQEWNEISFSPRCQCLPQPLEEVKRSGPQRWWRFSTWLLPNQSSRQTIHNRRVPNWNHCKNQILFTEKLKNKANFNFF